MAKLDKIIHERARLKILTFLAASSDKGSPFSNLQQKLELTSGNLSVQLKKLKSAGFVNIHKQFKNNKPHTTICLTPAGRNALKLYIEEMETLISRIRL